MILGMFPYVMIGVMPVFSADDWPKQLIHKLCLLLRVKTNERTENQKQSVEKEEMRTKMNLKKKTTLLLIGVYLTIQLLLPHSHWLTKGYNTWTNGLYGYSWDMMVHNWKHIQTTVTVVDKTNRKFYLNPQVLNKTLNFKTFS